MEEKLTDKEMQFIGFLSMMANTALYQMGKVTHPVTGKAEKDLKAAQMTIELIEMMQEKTKGNLTKNEESVLSDYLTHLRLNFVDEIEAEKKEKAPRPEKKEERPKPKEEKPAEGADDIVLNWEKNEPKRYGGKEEKK